MTKAPDNIFLGVKRQVGAHKGPQLSISMPNTVMMSLCQQCQKFYPTQLRITADGVLRDQPRCGVCRQLKVQP